MSAAHRQIVERQPQGAGAVLGGGAISGVIAGAVMLVVSMGMAAGRGLGAGLPVRAMAAAISGVTALLGGTGTLIEGWLVNLAVAAVLGLIYAAIGWHVRQYRTALIWGVIYGFIVWIVMTGWLLPVGNSTLAAYVPVMASNWLWLHIIFGVVLSISAPLRRGLAAGDQRQQPLAWKLPKAS